MIMSTRWRHLLTRWYDAPHIAMVVVLRVYNSSKLVRKVLKLCKLCTMYWPGLSPVGSQGRLTLPASRVVFISRLHLLMRPHRCGPQYDSRDYGFGGDDQSSVSPTTEDGSATQTTETGGTGAPSGAKGKEIGDAAVAGGVAASAGLDGQNSLSSYADDFADDESIVPPKPTSAESTPAAADNGNPEKLQNSSSNAAAGAAATASYSSGSNEQGTAGGSNDGHGDANVGHRSRAEEQACDTRRPSASDQSGNSNDDDGIRITTGSSTAPPQVSSSVHELRERLREADLENGRLREALEKSDKGDGGDRKELDSLKSQVEAARQAAAEEVLTDAASQSPVLRDHRTP